MSRRSPRAAWVPAAATLLACWLPAARGAMPVPVGTAGETSTRSGRPFTVFEHIRNRGRPDDLTACGLTPIELCYNTRTKEGVQASVRRLREDGYTGPVVFDIEQTNRSDHDVSGRHLREVLAWARESAPDCVVGHYAVGPSNLTPLNRPIGKSVDAFFPSMYAHNTNRRAWGHTAGKLVRQGHRQGKPVYLFLMPKFHGRTGGAVPQAFWSYQLHAAYRAGADGVVIWSSDRDRWDEQAGWWQATVHFLAELASGSVSPDDDQEQDQADAYGAEAAP